MLFWVECLQFHWSDYQAGSTKAMADAQLEHGNHQLPLVTTEVCIILFVFLPPASAGWQVLSLSNQQFSSSSCFTQPIFESCQSVY